MKRTFATLGTAVLLALGWALGAGSAAQATEAHGYNLVAWELGAGATTSNAFASPQKFVVNVKETEESLGALDSVLTDAKYCGKIFQIDLYNDNAITDSLIAGGHLDAPNQPAESFPNDNLSHWKYITTEACVVVTPTPTPTPTEPPVVVPPTEKPKPKPHPTHSHVGTPNSPPQLAHTGVNEGQAIGAGLIALVLFVAGILLVELKRRGKKQ